VVLTKNSLMGLMSRVRLEQPGNTLLVEQIPIGYCQCGEEFKWAATTPVCWKCTNDVVEEN